MAEPQGDLVIAVLAMPADTNPNGPGARRSYAWAWLLPHGMLVPVGHQFLHHSLQSAVSKDRIAPLIASADV